MRSCASQQRRLTPVHFPSASAEWSTPDDLFRELDDIFHFDLDACATATNAKRERYFTPKDDALQETWDGTVWMNPPHDRQFESFMRKAFQESHRGNIVVCPVPARTDTQSWHRYVLQRQVNFWGGRLREATRIMWPVKRSGPSLTPLSVDRSGRPKRIK